jgi:hypothetical protein
MWAYRQSTSQTVGKRNEKDGENRSETLVPSHAIPTKQYSTYVVGRVCVIAVPITIISTVSIVVILTIAAKAAHHCLILAGIERLNCGTHNGSYGFVVAERIDILTNVECSLRDWVVY